MRKGRVTGMSDRYLCKAKRTDNREWAEGYIVRLPTGEWEIARKCDNPPDCDPMWSKVLITYKVDPSTRCQYTGLTDKNGKKIWENDICIIHSSNIDEEDGFFTVEWDVEGARFALYGEGLTVDFDNIYSYECQVVGNMFDNPELVEESE